MALLEVMKHTKNAVKLLKSPRESGILKWTFHFLTEIGIVVFAITLSIWLHDVSVKNHQQEDVKEFLVDLKADLKEDQQIVKLAKESFSQGVNQKDISVKTLSYEFDALKNDTISEVNLLQSSFKFNQGNYEGFKSGGNISLIKNKELKKAILKYYEQNLHDFEKARATYGQQANKVLDLSIEGEETAKSKLLKTNVSILYKHQIGVLLELETISKNIDGLLTEIEKELTE